MGEKGQLKTDYKIVKIMLGINSENDLFHKSHNQ